DAIGNVVGGDGLRFLAGGVAQPSRGIDAGANAVGDHCGGVEQAAYRPGGVATFRRVAGDKRGAGFVVHRVRAGMGIEVDERVPAAGYAQQVAVEFALTAAGERRDAYRLDSGAPAHVGNHVAAMQHDAAVPRDSALGVVDRAAAVDDGGDLDAGVVQHRRAGVCARVVG